MSEQQVAELYERIVALHKEGVKGHQRFLCGWNAAIEAVIAELRKVEAEE
jgi:hypothetical protein